MRILRRRSNLEVSAKGFALFVAGLVVATFVGGALRTILSSERVHQRIVRELKSRFPKNEIDVQSIDVLLSRGPWPALGLRVHDLVVKQDVCGKLSFDLRVPETVMPVSLWSLRKREVRLGRVEIPGGRLELDYRPCAGADAAESPATPAASLRETVRTRGIRPPRLDWAGVSRTLDGIDLSHIEVTFKRAPQWKLRIIQARVRFDRELDVSAALDLQRSLPFGALSHLIGVHAVSDGGDIDWLLTSELKEGRLRWTGRWNLAENGATAKAVVTQVPLKELGLELHQMGFVAKEYKFKSAWLTCAAEWSGALVKPFASPVTLSSCHVEGAYGRAMIDRADIYADRVPLLATPAEIKIQRANVAGLAEALDTKILPAVLARPGWWTGSAKISDPRTWSAGGRLEGLEVFFSNRSVRGKQVVEAVEIDVERNGDAVSASLTDFKLTGGQAEGRITGGYDLGKRAGRFNVNLTQLSFSSSVQSVMVGGQLAPATLNGAGALVDGRLDAWTGRLFTSHVSGEGWRAENLEAQTSLSPTRNFVIAAHAARAVVDAQWRYFPSLQSITPEASDEYGWRDVSARLTVRTDGGSISNLKAAGTGGAAWLLNGTWLREGEAAAQLKLSGGGRTRAFRLHGDRSSHSIEPE